MSRHEVITWYTVYLAATDELVASGTAAECAKALGLASLNAFYCIVSHSHRNSKKYGKYQILTEKIKRSELQ